MPLCKRMMTLTLILCLSLSLIPGTAFAAYQTLRPWDTGSEVRTMQQALKTLGYDIKVDGSYGPISENTIRTFQKKHNLQPDGIAGQQTLTLLYALALGTGGAGSASPVYPPGEGTVTPSGRLELGSYGQEVIALQNKLNSLGFQTGRNDGVYDTGTRAAVIAYQRSVGLTADGIAGPQTLGKLSGSTAVPPAATPAPGATETPVPGRPNLQGRLELGSKGSEVILLQSRLLSLGYAPGRTDGSFDAQTRSAVLSFQSRNGLQTDGIAGPLTLQKLHSEAAIAAGSSSGSSAAAGSAIVATGNSGPLRFRRTPSAADSRNIIGSLVNGQAVAVIEGGGTWSRIRVSGTEGYVMSRYLRMDASAEPSIPPAAGGTPSQPVDPPAVLSGTATVSTPNGGSVRIRSGATTAGNNVLASVPNKATVQVLAVNGVWTQCSWQGRTGYIMSEFLRMTETETAPAPSPSDDPINEEESSPPIPGTLRMGDRDGADKAVSKLQRRLSELGFTLSADGIFGIKTHDALVSFQQQNSLNASGVADAQTLARLYATDAKPNQGSSSGVDISQGQIGGPSAGSVKLLHWYDVVKPALKGGPTIRIYHPASGVSFNIKVYSLGRHADAEPKTLKDTQLMNAAFGPASWDTRPVYVQLPGGTWTLATMHNYPHLSGSISDNGFGGHLCIHFLRDLEETQKADPNYGMQNQRAIRKAWKSMTGIDVE